MIDLSMVAALTAAGIVWKLTDMVQKYVELDLTQRKRKVHDPLQKHLVAYKSTNSPFIDIHFVKLDGVLRPKYSTIADLMEYLQFNVPKGIQTDELVKNYIVDCKFKSKLENDYDMTWEHPVTNLQFVRKYRISSFTQEEKDSDHFHSMLEMQATVDLWNFYFNKYPKILQYSAVLGKTKETHVKLR